MRVAHVITRLVVGGAQENTLATVLALRATPGVAVELLAGPTTGPEGSLAPQVAAVPGLLTILPALVRPVHPWLDLVALRQLTRHFRQTRPDIVHTHSGKAGVLGRLAARCAGVPVIIHTIHGPSFGPFQGVFANLLFGGMERVAGRVTTHFISVADAMTRQYLAAHIGRAEQFTRIFSGFDLQPFLNAKNDPAVRQELGLAPEDIVVGMIARLFKLKGHDDLFAIAADLVKQCPRMKFLFVGDGIWRERFQRKARKLKLERHVVFTGLVPPGDVPKFVGIMDLLVHLSRREGLPRALPQALAAGRPVVAYNCDGAAEVCFDEQTGFLIQPGDLPTLRDQLVRLASAPGLRAQLGANGRAFVEANFDVGNMTREIFALYERLLASRPAARP
ncbi:MAG: glycosyltransferase family 4 protein [Verrucomicrobiota bacterium]|jgi:glycosyltransferase involved in cell wall biosynthesis